MSRGFEHRSSTRLTPLGSLTRRLAIHPGAPPCRSEAVRRSCRRGGSPRAKPGRTNNRALVRHEPTVRTGSSTAKLPDGVVEAGVPDIIELDRTALPQDVELSRVISWPGSGWRGPGPGTEAADQSRFGPAPNSRPRARTSSLTVRQGLDLSFHARGQAADIVVRLGW